MPCYQFLSLYTIRCGIMKTMATPLNNYNLSFENKKLSNNTLVKIKHRALLFSNLD